MEGSASAEPYLVPESESELSDMGLDLLRKASALASSIAEPVKAETARIVRSMNCYYSNLIEGHQTQPRDIEKALANEFLGNSAQRALQEEAKAHIELQLLIDTHQDPQEWPASSLYV